MHLYLMTGISIYYTYNSHKPPSFNLDTIKYSYSVVLCCDRIEHAVVVNVNDRRDSIDAWVIERNHGSVDRQLSTTDN